MSIKEYRFLAPVSPSNRSNEQVADAHKGVRNDLLEAFGGFTSSTGNISWRKDDKGQVHKGRHIEYKVAFDDTGGTAMLTYIIKEWVLKRLNQQCVYLVDPTGTVSFIDDSTRSLDHAVSQHTELVVDEVKFNCEYEFYKGQ